MSDLIGKVFKRSGGKYPGYWVVAGLSPGGSCLCLGIGLDGDLVGVSNYQPYYVADKKEVGRVDVSEIRFSDSYPCDRREETSGVSPVLQVESFSDG